MMKFMFIGRRAAGTTRSAALAHLRDVHGQMVVSPPPDAGVMPAAYVQNHVFDGAYPAGDGPHALERDLVTLFWFEDFEALKASSATPYYLANLAPDEPRFVDRATVAKLPVVAHGHVEPSAGARFKLFLVLSRSPAADPGHWSAGLAAVTRRLRDLPGLAGLVENEVRGAPPGGAPFADTIFEVWFTERGPAATAANGLAAWIDALGAGIGDATRCFAVAAEEYDSERLRQLRA